MKGRNGEGLKFFAIAGAALTYAGAVIYVDIMFLQVVSKTFPGSGVLQALAYAGAIVTAVSALILPIALHWWFSPGSQFIWGLIFWGLDIFALGANSILAFEIATGSKDSFIEVWQVMSPATPLLAVVGWGIAFLFDPSHKLRHAVSDMRAEQIDILADEMVKAAKSAEVKAIILEGAKKDALDFAESVTRQRIEEKQTRHKASEATESEPPATEPERKTNPIRDWLDRKAQTTPVSADGTNGNGSQNGGTDPNV